MAASYAPYSKYKDSGVEWLGEIPEQWKVLKIKHLLRSEKGSIKTGPFGSHLKGDDMQGGEFKVINQRNVIDRDFSVGDAFISKNKFRELFGFKIFPDDILITTRGTIGKTAIAPKELEDTILHPCLMRMQIEHDKYVNDIVCLIIQEAGYFLEQLKVLSNATTIDVIYSENLKNVAITLPPTFEEQVKILKFLDHETAKIDTLIKKQQQLIKLLKEKRQAVISHAVTKGLNPDVSMKDSGVEWLGEVPGHWEIATVRRYLLEHRQGYYTTEAYVDDGTKLLRITDLRELGDISTRNCPKVSDTDSLGNYLLEEGDVVFARTGGAGSFGVIPKLTEEVAYASYLIRFRFLPRHFNRDYLRFMLVADSFQLAVKKNIHGGVNQNIHAEDIKDTFVASPPLEEQKEISLYLEKQTCKYAELIDKAESAISLIKERRTALISAAVTGKIDVRDWQAPEHKQNNKEEAA